MPQPGQKTVTLNEKIYAKAEEAAKKLHLKVARYVTNLILAEEA